MTQKKICDLKKSVIWREIWLQKPIKMVQILSTPLIVSFSGPQNLKTNGGNETIGGGLKQLEDIEDFLQIFSTV